MSEPMDDAQQRGDGLAMMLRSVRRRGWTRVGLSVLSFALLVGGVVALGYPFYTNLYQSRIQNRLDGQLASPAIKQAYESGAVEVGDSLTRIKIPAIGVDVIVVEGVSAGALRAGAGHYPKTPLPCQVGNVSIAGHRTTYGKPFANVDRLEVGDRITLETPIGACEYEVAQEPFVVTPEDLSVIAPTTEGALTLTTCHPKGSARRRLIVRAAMLGPTANA